ncbi:MAG: 4Fe-4S dicluster domain-containing protein [Chloroflexi bacterium]|nr:4Fe-4S dicluster domain-containing protein [Chloroflexota bacterium]
MNATIITPNPRSDLRSIIEKTSGQKVSRCYQCGKCTAGCPTAYAMDLTPRQVLRAVQLGLKDELMGSRSYWMCVFCQTCTARCPQQIDIARVMESLRVLSFAEGRAPGDKEIGLFHRHFMGLVERFGKVWETGLGGIYNLTSGHPFANLDLLPRMLSRGKLPLIPHKTGNPGEIRKIFERVAELERGVRDDPAYRSDKTRSEHGVREGKA